MPEVIGLGGELRWNLENREVWTGELNLKIAHLFDKLGVGNSLGHIGEEGCHLVGAFHVELVVVEGEPARGVDSLLGAYAYKYLLCSGMLPVKVMYVVGGNKRDACLLGNLYKPLV